MPRRLVGALSTRTLVALRQAPSRADLVVPLGAGACWLAYFAVVGFGRGAFLSERELAVADRLVACALLALRDATTACAGLALLVVLPLATGSRAPRRVATATLVLLAAHALLGHALGPLAERVRLAAERRVVNATLLEGEQPLSAPESPGLLASTTPELLVRAASRSGRPDQGALVAARRVLRERVLADALVLGAAVAGLGRRRWRWPWWLSVPLAGATWVASDLARWSTRLADWADGSTLAGMVAAVGVVAAVATGAALARAAWGVAETTPRAPGLELGRRPLTFADGGLALTLGFVAAGGLVALTAWRSPAGLQYVLPTRDGIGEPFALLELDVPAGGRLDPGGLRGRVVVVTYFTTTCGPCVGEIRALRTLQEQGAPRGLRCVLVNVGGEEDAAIAALAAAEDVSLPIVRARPELLRRHPHVGVPATFVVDRSGVLRHRHRGWGPRLLPRLRREIEALLPPAERP